MSAQAAAPEPGERAMEFVPTQGGKETTSAETLLVTAYVVMWALLFVFLVFGWRRQRHLESRLSELETSLDRGKAPRS